MWELVPSIETLFLNIQTILVLVTVFLASVTFIQWFYTPSQIPPGPLGWPIVGVLPMLGDAPYKTVQRWWDQYGDVFSIRMGSQLVVVVNGVEAMKEAFVKQSYAFQARPWSYFKKIIGNRGIVFSDGLVWKEHRRFTLRSLRDFGMGKISLQLKIHDELSAFMDELLKENEKPFDVSLALPQAISNIICNVIYGSRFEYNDPIFVKNIQALNSSVRNQTLVGMINFIPSLEPLFNILPMSKEMQSNVNLRKEYAQHQIDVHKENYDPANPRDFIDVYVTRMKQNKAQGISTTFAEDQLNRTIQDLFIAGTETLNNTIKWSFLFMLLNEDVQSRVQNEIDDVIGTGRMPTLQDRKQMPYTEATIWECQRLGNITLFSVPRCVTEDAVLCGYQVPKDTWIFFNRWGIHTNKRYWKDPEKFDPTRYLDQEGKLTQPPAFVPFGVGPRICAGETLAKMELFLFFTTILQKFKLRLPEGRPLPSTEPLMGINMCPKPYHMCAIPR